MIVTPARGGTDETNSGATTATTGNSPAASRARSSIVAFPICRVSFWAPIRCERPAAKITQTALVTLSLSKRRRRFDSARCARFAQCDNKRARFAHHSYDECGEFFGELRDGLFRDAFD